MGLSSFCIIAGNNFNLNACIINFWNTSIPFWVGRKTLQTQSQIQILPLYGKIVSIKLALATPNTLILLPN